MPLHVYKMTKSNKNNNYEKFENVVSATEKILVKRFKRVDIRGKRDRGVPVLFTDDVQKHIELLLKFRDQLIPKSNPFFARVGYTTPKCGYKL